MDVNAIPKLAPGCRLHPTRTVLLIPEGTLNLNEPAYAALSLVDGQHSVAAIAEQLLAQYEGAPAAEVQSDVLDLLARMEQRGVVRT